MVGAAQVYRMRDCFDTYATPNGLFVILDGLDEVSKQQYPKVRLALEGLSLRLSNTSEKNILLLTMRTQFYQQVKDDFRNSIGHALFIRPFTPTDIYEFLSRWPSRSTSSVAVAEIYADLTDRPTLREMCTNPLVLSMYVAEIESSGAVFTPESRTDFYRRVTDELVVRRRLQQTGRVPAPGKLQEQRERILGKLAYEHLLNSSQPSNSLRWADAIRVTREVLNCNEGTGEATFREIARETGLISEERKDESLRFIHLTFCEFLAAVEAIQGQKDGWRSLIRAHIRFQSDANPQTHTRLLELIPFAAGLVTRVRRTSLVQEVADLGNMRLLARCFLETKSYEHEAWPAFVEAVQSRLLTIPSGQWTEESLRDLQLFYVVVRDQQQCADYSPSMAPFDARAFFEALVSRQQDQLSTLFRTFAFQDAAAAFRLADACGLDLLKSSPEVIVSNCDQPAFLEIVIARALREERTTRDWAIVLSEAALRSRPVARSLDKMALNDQLERLIRPLPRRFRWDRGGQKTFYGQLVTIAVSGGDASRWEGVLMIRTVSTKGLPWSAPNVVAALLVVLICLLVPLMILDLRIHSMPKAFPLLLGGLLLILPLYGLTLWSLVGARFYANILNLSDSLSPNILAATHDKVKPALLPLFAMMVGDLGLFGRSRRAKALIAFRKLRGDEKGVFPR
jgi:hypothetical protein